MFAAFALILPTALAGACLIVFGVLFGVRPRTTTGEQNYAVFLFVGLLPWTFFATAVT